MKPQFSKLIIIVAGILFTLALIHGILINQPSQETSVDMSSIVAEMTITGSVFLTTCVWYYKKAAAENTAKIRIDHAKNIAEIEYEYFEKRARLTKELNLSEEEIYKIKEDSVLDELGQEAIAEDTEYLKSQFENNSADPEITIANMEV